MPRVYDDISHLRQPYLAFDLGDGAQREAEGLGVYETSGPVDARPLSVQQGFGVYTEGPVDEAPLPVHAGLGAPGHHYPGGHHGGGGRHQGGQYVGGHHRGHYAPRLSDHRGGFVWPGDAPTYVEDVVVKENGHYDCTGYPPSGVGFCYECDTSRGVWTPVSCSAFAGLGFTEPHAAGAGGPFWVPRAMGDDSVPLTVVDAAKIPAIIAWAKETFVSVPNSPTPDVQVPGGVYVMGGHAADQALTGAAYNNTTYPVIAWIRNEVQKGRYVAIDTMTWDPAGQGFLASVTPEHAAHQTETGRWAIIAEPTLSAPPVPATGKAMPSPFKPLAIAAGIGAVGLLVWAAVRR